MNGIVLDAFAGPGGWSEGLRMLGLCDVGIELDASACATRAAAGHHTIRADITSFAPDYLAGKVSGFVGSPECTTFSMAGGRAGTVVLDILARGIRDAFAGRKTRAACRKDIVRGLRDAGWPAVKDRPCKYKNKNARFGHKTPAHLTRAQKAARRVHAAFSASLVLEPARLIAACRPEWIALEQVPSVLPLWQVYAGELRAQGYSVWCGTLNSADYGVPQTRERAILIASRVRQVARPEPTHYDPRKGMQLWGTPWVSMADALGWGATGRPGPAVTAGGTSTGGAEPFPTRARELLEAERDSGNWILHTNRDQRPDGTRQTADPRSAPALTAKSGGQWMFRNNNNDHACARTLDEPAGTLFFGHRSNWAAWVREGEPQAKDSVRITVQEAAILQSFRPNYEWQGTKTKKFEQCGNAWCPRAAAAVVGTALGIDWQPLVDRYYAENQEAVA